MELFGSTTNLLRSMRTLLRTLPLLVLLAAPLQVVSGTAHAAQASMQVSFTVLASCTVAAHGATAPGVQCVQADGFLVAPHVTGTGTQAARLLAGSDAAGWTVYF